MNNALIPEEIVMNFEDYGQDISLGFEDVTQRGDYNPLINKPKVNDITLIGNKTSEELGLQDTMEALSVQEIERILYLDN